jgi:hypothetical protein
VEEDGWFSRLRNGLFLAQAQLMAANPSAAANLPLAVEAGVTAAEVLATEMLWRAVLLQVLGGWASDRLFEAGAEEMLAFGGCRGVLIDGGPCMCHMGKAESCAVACCTRAVPGTACHHCSQPPTTTPSSCRIAQALTC